MKIKPADSFLNKCSCICEPIVNCIYWVCGSCFSNKFKCEICETRFKNKNILACHIRESHSEIYAWGSSKKFKEMLESEKLI